MAKQYSGLTAKLHNRRVHLGRCEDDDSYCIKFKRLPDEDEKERVVVTELGLSGEAMETLVELFLHLNGESLYDLRIAKVRSELLSRSLKALMERHMPRVIDMMEEPPEGSTFENNNGVWEPR